MLRLWHVRDKAAATDVAGEVLLHAAIFGLGGLCAGEASGRAWWQTGRGSRDLEPSLYARFVLLAGR